MGACCVKQWQNNLAKLRIVYAIARPLLFSFATFCALPLCLRQVAADLQDASLLDHCSHGVLAAWSAGIWRSKTASPIMFIPSRMIQLGNPWCCSKPARARDCVVSRKLSCQCNRSAKALILVAIPLRSCVCASSSAAFMADRSRHTKASSPQMICMRKVGFWAAITRSCSISRDSALRRSLQAAHIW